MIAILSSIFDLDGPSFLAVYTVGFAIAFMWSLARRSRANARFALPGAEETKLTDPYEIAWLAGGVPRCAQVAVVKLITCGAVQWRRTRILRESRLVAGGSAEAGFNEMERALFSAIRGHGDKGMRLTEIPALVAARISGLEARVAKRGLRPTQSEANRGGCLIILPMLFLVVFGAAKVWVGITRDKPVLFLIALIVVTVVVAAVVASRKKRLTPAGEKLLLRMRAERETPGDTLAAVALFGAGWAGDPMLAGLDEALRKDISRMGNPTGSSGCSGATGCGGGSSGCSSGCGGGGCGGCGGGD